MKKTILITGATDGIGKETAKKLAKEGHNLLVHGRNVAKVNTLVEELGNDAEGYVADLSNISSAFALANEIKQKHKSIDVLINNAGVFKADVTKTKDDLDLRFVVNTIAPYILTKELHPLLHKGSRIVNLSSAAQAPVEIDDLLGKVPLPDSTAYAQSKLALTMWSNYLSKQDEWKGRVIVAVNPASFLGSKMVKDAYGVAGKNLSIGADILVRTALSDEFSNATGKYYDNDIGQFTSPHPDALDTQKCSPLVETMEKMILRHQ